MYAEYQAGATLEEVGARAGITRERVRQLFKAAGLATRSRELAGAQKQEARALRVDQHRRLIVEGFRDGMDLKTIGEEHSFGMKTIRKILKADMPAREYQRLTRKPMASRYTDQELLACLRQAAAVGTGMLTMRSYTDYAERRRKRKGKPWVSSQTYVARFGSWADGLKAAGLEANATPAWKTKRIDREECVAAIRSVSKTLGRIPTAEEYGQHARASEGSMPSLATVKKRCGSWFDAVGMA
jgi:Homing endonuclease associated repeat/Sigma-70, region 4